MHPQSGDTAAPTRVLVVDDDHARAELLQLWIDGFEGYEWVGHHPVRRGLKRLAADLRPDIVLLDLTLPEDEFSDPDHDCGRRCAIDLREALPEVRILIVTTNAAAQGPDVMKRTGAEGLLLDSSIRGTDRVQRVRDALDGIRNGFTLVDGKAADITALAARCGLEPRHLELLPWLFYGVSTKQIAERRHQAQRTTDSYRHQVLTSLRGGLNENFGNVTEAAIAFYRELGITPDDPR